MSLPGEDEPAPARQGSTPRGGAPDGKKICKGPRQGGNMLRRGSAASSDHSGSGPGQLLSQGGEALRGNVVPVSGKAGVGVDEHGQPRMGGKFPDHGDIGFGTHAAIGSHSGSPCKAGPAGCHFGGSPRDGAPQAVEGEAHHEGHAGSGILHRQHGRLHFPEIEHGLDEEEISPSLGQSLRLDPEGLPGFFEGQFPEGGKQFPQGAHGACDKPPGSGRGTGQGGRPRVDFLRPCVKSPCRELDGAAAERVCFDDVRPCRPVGSMYGFHDFGAAEVHFLRQGGGIPSFFRQKRSHASVEDQDPFPVFQIPEQFPGIHDVFSFRPV